MTWGELLAEMVVRVHDRQVAHWMCETASGVESSELDAMLGSPVGERAVARLDAMVARHDAGEPLQYILGHWGFRHLDLAVDERALIPRPETELLVEACLGLLADRLAARLEDPVTVVDLGTGTGAIGLALASELPLDGVTVWLTDVCADALALASANLTGIGRPARNVRIAEPGSWFQPLDVDLRFDLVVANPPYVPDRSPDVEAVVSDHEPHVAVFGGGDGLDHVREIVAGTPTRLRPAGWLAMEIGAGQGDRVRALLGDAGFTSIEIGQDLAGHDRIALARTRH